MKVIKCIDEDGKFSIVGLTSEEIEVIMHGLQWLDQYGYDFAKKIESDLDSLTLERG